MRLHLFLALFIVFGWQLALARSSAGAESPKRPLPTTAELKAAETRVLGAMRAKFSSHGKEDDARAWFDAALELRDDPVGQCVLLIRARELAQANGDVSQALAAIDALGDRFEFDVLVVKASTLERLSKSARAKPARRQLLEAGSRLAEDALAVEQFDLAERFAEAAAIAANYDQELRQQTRVIGRAVNYARQRSSVHSEAVAAARERLATEPDDPRANEVLGLHLCFAERDWVQGLQRLRKSADARLVKLAREETTPPQDARKQSALADAWWELAIDPNRAEHRARFVLRAAHWYRRALAVLDGQAKAKAQDRLSKAMSTIVWVHRHAGFRLTEAIELQLTESVVLRLVQIPRGVARNAVVESFYLSETEITQEQWGTLMPENPSSQRGDGLLPVHDVTHEQAEEFAKALNRAGIDEGFQFRLPTAAEWLHACLDSYSGLERNVRDMVDRQAWRQANSEGRLHSVASLRPNGWNLFDMLGNCAEWTEDSSRAFGFSYADRINAAKLHKQPPATETPEGHHAPTIGLRIAADRRAGGLPEK